MKIIEHTSKRLTLKDSSGCMWVLVLFFLLIACALGLFTIFSEVSLVLKSGILIILFSIIAVVLWMIYRHPGIYISFDKMEDSATIKRRSFLSDEIQTYKLNELDDLELYEYTFEGDPFWGIVLKLKGNRHINVGDINGHDKDALQKNVDSINNFLQNNY
jgi:hypothetical protein